MCAGIRYPCSLIYVVVAVVLSSACTSNSVYVCAQALNFIAWILTKFLWPIASYRRQWMKKEGNIWSTHSHVNIEPWYALYNSNWECGCKKQECTFCSNTLCAVCADNLFSSWWRNSFYFPRKEKNCVTHINNQQSWCTRTHLHSHIILFIMYTTPSKMKPFIFSFSHPSTCALGWRCCCPYFCFFHTFPLTKPSFHSPNILSFTLSLNFYRSHIFDASLQ